MTSVLAVPMEMVRRVRLFGTQLRSPCVPRGYFVLTGACDVRLRPAQWICPHISRNLTPRRASIPHAILRWNERV